MKKLFTVLFIVLFMVSTTQAQDTLILVKPSPQQLHNGLVKKHKTNKAVGWIMVGSGILMMAGGVAINISENVLDFDDSNNSEGLWLSYLGGATTIASIPFFAAASKNKRKAKLVLKGDVVVIQNKVLDHSNYLALGLQIAP